MLDSSAMDDEVKDEYPFRFLNGPMSLVTLASTELSLTLWRSKISNCGETAPDKVLTKNFSCAEFLSVPSSIEGIIDEKRKNLRKWAKFYLKLDKDLRSVFSSTWDDIVFDPNGAISYSKTAAKAIKKDGIDDEFKLKIACIFCLEDEIKRLWPTISRNGGCDEFSLANEKSTLYYWYNVMSDKKPTNIMGHFWSEYYVEQNWASALYFWQHLGDNEKVSTALKIFTRHSPDTLICLLPTLKEHQAREVFEKKACEILSVLLSNHEYVENMLVSWTHMENIISVEAFQELIRGLWKLMWYISKTDRMWRYKVDGILMEMWTRAPDHFKSYILNHSAEFFDGLPIQSAGFVFNYGHKMDFLLDLLRRNSPEFRKTIWSNNWQKIVIRAKPSDLKKFIELCLPDNESIDNFKSKDMPNFKQIQTSLIKYGFYSDLADYSNFCSKTSTLGNELSQQILRNHMGMVITSLLDGDNFENFNSFVDGLFSDAESASKFKQSLLWSPRSVNSLFCIFNKGRLEDCQEIITRFATSEENLEEMKSKFLDYSRKYLTTVQTNEFDVKSWEELLKWCTKNEDEIAAFKKSLDIDKIFEFMFGAYSFKSWSMGYLDAGLFFYDNFSKWYFDNKLTKRAFKLEKINTYNKGRAICQFLKTKQRRFVERMLNWAFDKDENKIKKFQRRLAEENLNFRDIPCCVYDEHQVPITFLNDFPKIGKILDNQVRL